MRLFDQALELDPENLQARLGRANVNVARNQLAAADQDVDQVLQEKPDNFMADYLRGWEQVKRQKYAAADRTFDRISAGFPSFPSGYYLQGAAKYGLGQFAAAELILARYLNLVPGEPRARRLIASTALAQPRPMRKPSLLSLSIITATSALLLGAPIARADFIFNISSANSAISPFPPPTQPSTFTSRILHTPRSRSLLWTTAQMFI